MKFRRWSSKEKDAVSLTLHFLKRYTFYTLSPKGTFWHFKCSIGFMKFAAFKLDIEKRRILQEFMLGRSISFEDEICLHVTKKYCNHTIFKMSVICCFYPQILWKTSYDCEQNVLMRALKGFMYLFPHIRIWMVKRVNIFIHLKETFLLKTKFIRQNSISHAKFHFMTHLSFSILYTLSL